MPNQRLAARVKLEKRVQELLSNGPLTRKEILAQVDLDGRNPAFLDNTLVGMKARREAVYSMETRLWTLIVDGVAVVGDGKRTAPPPDPAPARAPSSPPPKTVTRRKASAAPRRPAQAPRETPAPAPSPDPPPAAAQQGPEPEHQEETLDEQTEPETGQAVVETPTTAALDLEVPRFLDGLDVDPEERRRRNRQARARLLIQASDLRIHAAQLLEGEEETS